MDRPSVERSRESAKSREIIFGLEFLCRYLRTNSYIPISTRGCSEPLEQPADEAFLKLDVTLDIRTTNCFKPKTRNSPLVRVYQAHPEGFEPPTLGSEDRCSNPLS